MIFYPGQGISSDMIKEWAGPHPQKSKDLALETWTALAPFPILFQRNSPLKNDSHKGRQRWRKPFEMYLFFSLEAEKNFFPPLPVETAKGSRGKDSELSCFLGWILSKRWAPGASYWGHIVILSLVSMTSSQEEALGPLRPLLILQEQGSESFNDAAQHSVTWCERGGRKIKVHRRRWNYEGGILWRYGLLRLVWEAASVWDGREGPD